MKCIISKLSIIHLKLYRKIILLKFSIIHFKLIQFEAYNRPFEMYNLQFKVHNPHFRGGNWKITKYVALIRYRSYSHFYGSIYKLIRNPRVIDFL